MPYEALEPAIPSDYWMNKEKDPNGKAQHEKGAKLDAGKLRPALVFRGFARALEAVAEIGTFGANKYTDNGWLEVPRGQERYEDAHLRHKLKEWKGEELDPESQYSHLAHTAWNALAELELFLRGKENGRTTRGT